jgi:hypothetical protein
LFGDQIVGRLKHAHQVAKHSDGGNGQHQKTSFLVFLHKALEIEGVGGSKAILISDIMSEMGVVSAEFGEQFNEDHKSSQHKRKNQDGYVVLRVSN